LSLHLQTIENENIFYLIALLFSMSGLTRAFLIYGKNPSGLKN